jgi:hypothetical protein
VDKTCKSSGIFRVAIFEMSSGARVRNTWVICHEAGDNSGKPELIPNVNILGHPEMLKAGDRKAWHFMMSPRPIS